MTMKFAFAALAAVCLVAGGTPASAAQHEIEGAVTAVNDGQINGWTHCPYRTATIDDLEIVWACGGPLPVIGSVWRVTYFDSYPSGETLVSRQRIPVN